MRKTKPIHNKSRKFEYGLCKTSLMPVIMNGVVASGDGTAALRAGISVVTAASFSADSNDLESAVELVGGFCSVLPSILPETRNYTNSKQAGQTSTSTPKDPTSACTTKHDRKTVLAQIRFSRSRRCILGLTWTPTVRASCV